MSAPHPAEPPADCALCPRLVAYRDENADAEPQWFNGAVPSFGGEDAALLIVGLAPGRTGANATGRPFTGDAAGDVLYPALLLHGLAFGRYEARADDGVSLVGCMITNAVRCAPPQNKPTGAEATTCRAFLVARFEQLPNLRAILALGRIAHDNTLKALGVKAAAAPFAHEAEAALTGPNGPVTLVDSYHCSRYNMNTGRLTQPMFNAVVGRAKAAAGL